MRGILPEIEQFPGAPVGIRDVIRAILDGFEDIAVGYHARVIEALQDLRILCLDQSRTRGLSMSSSQR
jgi:hypothetical protein